MKTTFILLGAAFVLLALSISLISIELINSAQTQTIDKQYSYTKAICDENNFCQDYIIVCKESNLISQTPITGAFVQFSEGWEDPRNLEQRERSCE